MIRSFLSLWSRHHPRSRRTSIGKRTTTKPPRRLGAETLEPRQVLAAIASGDFGWAIETGGDGYVSSYYSGTGYSSDDYYRNSQHIASDSKGNVYIAGSFYGDRDFDPGPESFFLTANSWSRDIFVAKYSPTGALLWAKQIGGNMSDKAQAIAVDAADNVTIAGSFESQVDFDPNEGTSFLTGEPTNSNVFVAQYSSTGVLKWARQFEGVGDDEAGAMTVDPAGNVAIAGRFNSSCDFDPGAGTAILSTSTGVKGSGFVASLTNMGDFRWVRQYDATVDGLAADANKNIVVTGRFWYDLAYDPAVSARKLSTSSQGAFTLQLSDNGGVNWARSLGGRNYSNYYGRAIGTAVTVDSQNNVILAGAFSGTVGFDSGSSSQRLTSAGNDDAFILKWTPSGSLLWAKRFGSVGNDRMSGVTITSNDQIVAAGEFEFSVDFDPGAAATSLTSSGYEDAFVLGLTKDADFRWVEQFGGLQSQMRTDSMATRLGQDGKRDALLAGSFTGEVQWLPTNGQKVLVPDSSYYYTSDNHGVFGMLVRDIDNLPPVATFSAIPSPLTAPLSGIDLRFNEPVTGVDLTDFIFTRNGATIGLDQLGLSGSGANYTLSAPAPIALPAGSYTVTLKAEGAGISDGSGNTMTANASVTWTVGASDTTPPSAQFSPVPSRLGAALPSIAITFSEPVNGVDIGSFSLTRNDLPVSLDGVTITGEDATYTLKGLGEATKTPGTYKLTLNAAQAVITDATGNVLSQSASVGWILVGKDTQAPTAIFAALSPERNSAVQSIGVTFSEPVYGVDINDFLLTRDGKRVPLVGVKVTGTAENYTFQGLGAATAPAGSYALQIRPDARIVDAARNSLSELASVAWKRTPLTATLAAVDSVSNPVGTNFNLKFSLPVGRPNLNAFRLTMNGRVVSLRGATLTRTAGDSFILALPARITAAKGAYVLTFSGPRSQVSSDGVKFTAIETLSWRRV